MPALPLPSHAEPQPIPLEGEFSHSDASQPFDELASTLLNRLGESGRLVVTSMHAAEGKTTTAVNLALALNFRHVPVLLTELALQRPQFASFFGQPPIPYGIEDVLTGHQPLEAVTCKRRDSQLRVAMLKTPQPPKKPFFNPRALSHLVPATANEKRWLIFDGPALTDLQDAQAANALATLGTVLLVVRIRNTSRKSLRKALAMFDTPPLVICNDVR